MSSIVPHRIYPRTVRLQSLTSQVLSAKQQVADVLAMPMISVPECATSMNVSINTVRRWLKDGTIKGFRAGRQWWKIPVSEVARLKGIQ